MELAPSTEIKMMEACDENVGAMIVWEEVYRVSWDEREESPLLECQSQVACSVQNDVTCPHVLFQTG